MNIVLAHGRHSVYHAHGVRPVTGLPSYQLVDARGSSGGLRRSYNLELTSWRSQKH